MTDLPEYLHEVIHGACHFDWIRLRTRSRHADCLYVPRETPCGRRLARRMGLPRLPAHMALSSPGPTAIPRDGHGLAREIELSSSESGGYRATSAAALTRLSFFAPGAPEAAQSSPRFWPRLTSRVGRVHGRP